MPAPYQRAEYFVDHEGDGDTNDSWNTWNISKEPWKDTGGNWRIETTQITALLKEARILSLRYQRELAVTQAQVKNYLFELV